MNKFLSFLVIFIGLLLIATGIYAYSGHLGQPKTYFIPGFLFLLLGFLNAKFGTYIKSHHFPFFLSTIIYYILIMGLITGEFTIKRHHYIRSIDPQSFWVYSTYLFIFGTGALCYGIWQLRKSR